MRCWPAVVLFCGCLRIIAAPGVSIVSSRVPGVDLLGPPDAEYAAAIRHFFGPPGRAEVTTWLPFGVLVANHTAETLVAVAVRWQLTSDSGTMQYSLAEQAFDSPRALVPPGGNGVALPAGWLADSLRLPPPSNLPDFRGARTIEATLDGVVFASGQFAGPDTGKEFESYVADTTIPGQVAARVLAMKDSGEPVSRIVAFLESQSRPTDHQVDRWWDAEAGRRIARQLLSSYRSGGEAGLYQVAATYTAAPAIRLFR